MLRIARGVVLGFFAFVASLLLVAAATAQDRITLEAERHEGFGRIIVTFVDRMTLPAFEIGSENGVLILSFEANLSGTMPDVGTPLFDYVAIARLDPDNRAIRMGLRGPMRINTIEAGEQLFIDLLPPGWVGLPPSLPPETVARLAQRAEDAARIAEERRRAEMVQEYKPVATVRVGRHPTFSRAVFEWNVGTRAEFSQDGDTARISFDWPVPIDLYEIQSDMPPEIVAVSNSVDRIASSVELEVAEGTGMRFYEDGGNRFILDFDFPNVWSDSVDALTLAENGGLEVRPTAPESVEEEAPQNSGPPQEQTSVTPYVTTIGSTVRVIFPFESDTPAAIFRRGNTVWMLFDTAANVTGPEAGRDLNFESLVGEFTVERTGGAQVVRMDLNQQRLATIGSEGRAWVLSLGDVLLNASDPVVLDRRQASNGFYEVVADLGRPARVHQFRDPDVGDILEIVTVYPPARNVVRDLDYVDFSAPSSVHGLVVRPLHDGVSVRIEDRLAVIAADTGLILSPAQELRYRTPGESRVTNMNLSAQLALNPDDFVLRRDEILRRTATAEGRELDRYRLELARFYLSNNLAHEALGVLKVLNGDLRQPDLEPVIRITRAAANALAARPAEAIAALDDELLRDEADAMIWRTIARVQANEFEGARLDALGAEAVIDAYPNWLRSRFHLAAIRAMVSRGDAATAARFIGKIDLAVLTADQISEYELLSAMLDELNGRNGEALQSYGRVIAADRRPTTAEAVLRTIALLDKMGQLDVARAVDTLAVQATLWRGDALELEITRQLADLQYRNGDYRDALILTREATAVHSGSETLTTLTDRARTEFAGLYLDGRADSLEPIDALGLYYDFRHLTPPGTQGDQMIRNLAQRLIKVDLLSQAASLLEYQIDQRLSGAARSQVAADLAIIHIANREPAKALQVLYRTRLAGLPPGLERQRRVLEARALIDAHRYDLALDMLSSMTGRDTELLRVEALWRSERYREVGEKIELLYAADLERGNLSPVARMNVVRAGIAYVLAKDQIGLSRLRSRYAPVMSNAPEWPMFAFVTESVEPTSREFREIARQVAGVDSLNAFLNAYREVYTADNALTPLRAARDAGAV